VVVAFSSIWKPPFLEIEQSFPCYRKVVKYVAARDKEIIFNRSLNQSEGNKQFQVSFRPSSLVDQALSVCKMGLSLILV
jgi:hypothetical protein